MTTVVHFCENSNESICKNRCDYWTVGFSNFLEVTWPTSRIQMKRCSHFLCLGELLSQLEMFEFLMFLFTSDGNVKCEMVVGCHLKSRCFKMKSLKK